MEWEFELIAGPYGGTTEGPVWDGRALLFTHIPGSRIMRFDPEIGECTEYRVGTNRTNGLSFDAHGNLYGCCAAGRSIVRFEADGSITTIVDRLDGKRLNTPNDLAIDARGRVWFTNPGTRGASAPPITWSWTIRRSYERIRSRMVTGPLSVQPMTVPGPMGSWCRPTSKHCTSHRATPRPGS